MFCYPRQDPLEVSLEPFIDEISALQEDIQDNWPTVGRLLFAMHRACGKKRSFMTVIKNLNMEHSTANYLIQLVKKFDSMEIDPPLDIPWRHLTEVLRFINPVDLAWILNLCRTHSRGELIELRDRGYFSDH